ncbi:MAG TPA: glycosyltransferase family 4 protein [Candidatus Binataceae bacterium]|nr:glycosyltransferase family 4 protein [Candidatus Binataceae bacterium]
MRFLFVSDFVEEPDSGAAGSLLAIGEALRQGGNSVDYIWRGDQSNRIKHPRLDQMLELPKRQYEQVARQLNQADYDVVIVSQPYAYQVYERLISRHPNTLFLNRTHGWEERGYEAEQRFNWRRDSGPAGTLLRTMSRIFTRRACRRTARSAAGIISPSSPCARFIVDRYDLPATRVAVIPYGLDAGFREMPLRQPIDRAEMRMLFAGQYLPRKGTRLLESLLPRIARDYPNALMTFVVPSESMELVNSIYRGAFETRLRVLEWVPRGQLRDIYLEHDLFLFPSLFEGFGKVCLEAMALGLCVIGYDEGGLSDLTTSGREALFCAPGSEAAYAEFIDAVLRNPAWARDIGIRAQRLARNRTWARTAEETENFCARLITFRRTGGEHAVV